MLRGDKPAEIAVLQQKEQLKNPDAIVTIDSISRSHLLGKYGCCYQGTSTADNSHFQQCFWESEIQVGWELLQNAPSKRGIFEGRELAVNWKELEASTHGYAIRGREAWGKKGVSLSPMSSMPSTIYLGQKFTDSAPTIIPFDEIHLAAIFVFAESGELVKELRKLNSKLSVNNGYINKIPFDLTHWQKVAAEKYPNGLPEPESDDPTQWLFHGRPEASTAPLQVAVARLLGYHYRESDEKMRPASGRANRSAPDEFAAADKDGIVVPPV